MLEMNSMVISSIFHLWDVYFWEQAACNDEALNLCRSFKDIKNFCVAEPLLNKLPVLGVFSRSRDSYRCCRCLNPQLKRRLDVQGFHWMIGAERNGISWTHH